MDPYEGRYRYCPRCRCEYRPGFAVCADCGVDLVDELPPEADDTAVDRDLEALQSWVGTDPVAVLVTMNGVQADLARSVLVGAAIPSSVWGMSHHAGWEPFRVMVHKDDEIEARELLANLFSAEGGWEAEE
jgi:hypothetical protein